MTGFRSAVAFLTILPAGTGRTNEGMGLAAARAWFPTVGLLLGSALAALDLFVRWGYIQGSPDSVNAPITVQILSSSVVVVALVLVTRALHLDGFMDTCDALLGGSSPRHRIQILKDPCVGAFAVAGAACLLLLKVAAISALPDQSRSWILILVPCLARWAMLLTMEIFPYVGGDGLGAAFLRKQGRGQMVFGLTATLVAGVGLVGLWSLALLALASLVAWGFGAWATRLLGGLTGDIYGAVNETVEVITLLFAALLTAGAPAAPFFQFAGTWFS